MTTTDPSTAKPPTVETQQAAETKTAKPAPPKRPSRKKRPTQKEITLAQHVRLQVKGEQVHFRAGDIVVIGDRPGQLPPAILERQPLLDLEHPNNQAGQAALAKIDDKARKADERARGARHHILDHLGTPPKRLPARHGIVG